MVLRGKAGKGAWYKVSRFVGLSISGVMLVDNVGMTQETVSDCLTCAFECRFKNQVLILD